MFKANPYRPGAGLMPTYLAGRDTDIAEMENLFDALCLQIPTQSVIFSGLRGVGKTVLMNRLQSVAEEKHIFCKHIEVEARNDFISQEEIDKKVDDAKEEARRRIEKMIEDAIEKWLEENCGGC